MSQKDLFQVLETLQSEFAPPFLPEGFVSMQRLADNRMEIRIADRDVVVGADGNVEGSGMAVGPGAEWDISPRS